jgi:UDP-N-acetylglucosamine acyltransferase
MATVHPSAIVERYVELDDDVVVGPFCHVQAGVRVGKGTRLLGHVVLAGNTTIGPGNTFHPFAVVGGEPQIRKGSSGATTETGGALLIGEGNVFRESVTVSVSSGDGATTIGSNNLFMAGCHVAHDVAVGSRCVVANAVQLAGHVAVEDWVTFGGLSGAAQHVRIGEGAFVAAGAMCERDVPPFVIAQGDRARVRALNVVGLERRGVPPESIAALRRAFARLWSAREGGFEDALRSLERSDAWVARLAAWLEDPSRSVRPAKRAR